jgi:DNA end-binding protein Ku
MPPRSSWKGYLRLSLVSVPVQAFTANVTGGGEIHFNQLHEKCHSRIRYKKVCPVHGEVPASEIVSGYEYAKGQYVVVDPEELETLQSESDRAINIDTFVGPDEIDPLFFDGRNYYLVPDTPIGQKPYAVLYKAMEKQHQAAVGRCVFSGRAQLVLVRPLDGLLLMTMLRYENQVRKPEAFVDDVGHAQVSSQELKLAETLIAASTAERFDFSSYEDDYTERLTELINAKVEGKQIVAPPSEEPAPVINLMDALRKSVAHAKHGAPARGEKPPKKLAASRRRAESAPRRRKSS